MEVDSFQFLLRQRGNFDDVLKLMGALLFSSQFRFYTRFQPENKDRYPGHARYRDLYPEHLARLLWWLESGEDIFYPTSRSAVFLPECLLEDFEEFF
ncbi:hypothetical protein OUZ56_011904 [Daphnia magna]|uniref:Uncharacterized protein n=1 Tax=Daphnia magna TaxID=35525 RepID=A0ABQ9Z1M4_9CRUS|nr:hypothetical protein OUZ56_011904 [Daphnia magna]